MINHEGLFRKLDESYDKLYELYYTFNAEPTIRNKNSLLMQLKTFGKLKTQLTASIKNVYLGKEIK